MPALDLPASLVDSRVDPHTPAAHAPLGAGGTVLAVGALAAAALAVLTALDPGGTGWLWELAHWTIAALAAAIATGLSLHGADGHTRQVRLAAVVALVLWTLGNAAWAILALTGTPAIPSLTDVFMGGFLVPVAWMLWLVVHDRLGRADELAFHVDALLVLAALAAVLIAASGDQAYTLGGLPGLLVIGYPILYLGMGAAALLAVVATRGRPTFRGGAAFGVGLLLMGLAYAGWSVPIAVGKVPDPTLNVLFSVGPLVAAFGAMTWSEAGEPTRRWGATARWIGWTAGPVALVVVATASSLGHHASGPVAVALHALLLVCVALLVLRLAFHIRERGTVLRALHETRVENERLIARLQAELEERERAQQRLIDASRMAAVGELAAAVAHEVNNPLTSVLGYADLLLAMAPADVAYRTDLEVIRSESIRVRDRVRALLDFATPRRAQLVPSDLAAVVAGPLELLRYHLDRSGIVIDVEAEPMPLVALDPPAIQQVLVHVLSILASAMPRGGRIAIRIAPAGASAVIRFDVDGDGVEVTELARWLTPFDRADDADGSRRRLAAAVGVLRGHGGIITTTTRPGGGPRVEILLPAGDTLQAA